MTNLRTHRATDAEKATAWDMLMSSTADDATAMQSAWEWLDSKVARREYAERVADGRAGEALRRLCGRS